LDYRLEYELIKNVPDRFYKVETICDVVVLKEKTRLAYNG